MAQRGSMRTGLLPLCGHCEQPSCAAIPMVPDELWSLEIATSSTSGGLLATSRLQEPGDCHGRLRALATCRGAVDTLRLAHLTYS